MENKQGNEWAVLSADRTKLLALSHDLNALRSKFGSEGVVYTKLLSPGTFFAF